MPIAVHSEIGRLRSVVVHQPGREIDRMTPGMMQELLFDDILHGARAREEQGRERPMRQIDSTAATYDGPRERRLPETRK